MAGTDFTLDLNQEILKWLFGKTTAAQPVTPLHVRWMSADDSTSLSPGTEVSAGAASRINVTFGSVSATAYSDGYSTANVQDSSTGSLVWTGPSSAITATELWDSSVPPRRLMYDKNNFGFTVNTGDVFEYTAPSSGIALQGMAFEAPILQQALSWALGKSTGWTRPVGPFKIKLKQYDDLLVSNPNGGTTSLPKSTLEAAPMQTVTFGAVETNGDHQAIIRSDVNVVFPVISDSLPVVVQGYEIWDSSSTPRKIAVRKPGQDYERDGYISQFVVVPSGNTLTIPLGTLKLTLGRGDGSSG